MFAFKDTTTTATTAIATKEETSFLDEMSGAYRWPSFHSQSQSQSSSLMNSQSDPSGTIVDYRGDVDVTVDVVAVANANEDCGRSAGCARGRAPHRSTDLSDHSTTSTNTTTNTTLRHRFDHAHAILHDMQARLEETPAALQATTATTTTTTNAASMVHDDGSWWSSLSLSSLSLSSSFQLPAASTIISTTAPTATATSQHSPHSPHSPHPQRSQQQQKQQQQWQPQEDDMVTLAESALALRQQLEAMQCAWSSLVVSQSQSQSLSQSHSLFMSPSSQLQIPADSLLPDHMRTAACLNEWQLRVVERALRSMVAARAGEDGSGGGGGHGGGFAQSAEAERKGDRGRGRCG